MKGGGGAEGGVKYGIQGWKEWKEVTEGWMKRKKG